MSPLTKHRCFLGSSNTEYKLSHQTLRNYLLFQKYLCIIILQKYFLLIILIFLRIFKDYSDFFLEVKRIRREQRDGRKSLRQKTDDDHGQLNETNINTQYTTPYQGRTFIYVSVHMKNL